MQIIYLYIFLIFIIHFACPNKVLINVKYNNNKNLETEIEEDYGGKNKRSEALKIRGKEGEEEETNEQLREIKLQLEEIKGNIERIRVKEQNKIKKETYDQIQELDKHVGAINEQIEEIKEKNEEEEDRSEQQPIEEIKEKNEENKSEQIKNKSEQIKNKNEQIKNKNKKIKNKNEQVKDIKELPEEIKEQQPLETNEQVEEINKQIKKTNEEINEPIEPVEIIKIKEEYEDIKEQSEKIIEPIEIIKIKKQYEGKNSPREEEDEQNENVTNNENKAGHYIVGNHLYYHEDDGNDYPYEIAIPGFYMDIYHPDQFIQCSRDGSCQSKPLPTTSEKCNASKDGKLIKMDNGFAVCTKINYLNIQTNIVETDHYVSIPFMDSIYNDRYMIHHASDIFSFDRTSSTTYYVATINSTAIVFDPSYPNTADLCADTSGLIIDRIIDFCSPNSSGMYYSCSGGKCTSEYQIRNQPDENNGESPCNCSRGFAALTCRGSEKNIGYYYEDSTQYLYNGAKCSPVGTATAAIGYYWNGYQYNKVSKFDGSKFKSVTPPVVTSDYCKDKKNEIVDTGFSLVFCDSNGMVRSLQTTANEELIFTKGITGSLFTNTDHYYALTKTKNSLTISSSNNNSNNYYLHDSQILHCDHSPLCSSTTEAGFYLISTVSSGNQLVQCTQNQCAPLHTPEQEVIYIDEIKRNHLIHCYPNNGCVRIPSRANDKKGEVYLNYAILDKEKQKVPLENGLIKCKVVNGDIICSLASGSANEVFLNANNPLEIIQCRSDGCTLKTSTAKLNQPEFYINSDVDPINTTTNGKRSQYMNQELLNPNSFTARNSNSNSNSSSSYPLNLIRCRNTGTGAAADTTCTCEIITAHHGDVYINANPYDSNTYPLIICEEGKGCRTNTGTSESVTADADADTDADDNGNADAEGDADANANANANVNAVADTSPSYYVNSGSAMANRLNDTLIKCDFVNGNTVICAIQKADINDVYINYSVNSPTYPLIKCSKNGCKPSSSTASMDDKEYYMNSGNTSNKPLHHDLIECSYSPEQVTCKELENIGIGIYSNANYAEPQDPRPLIQCSENAGCQAIVVSVPGNDGRYYVNAGATDLTHALLFCSSKGCEKQTPKENTYYVSTDETTKITGLVECGAPLPSESGSSYSALNKRINSINSRRRKRALLENPKKCILSSSFSSDGYYLNAGYNRAEYQVIRCDKFEGCEPLKVNLGYYLNVADAQNPIIKCEKEGKECTTEKYRSCPEASNVQPGDYCYEDDHLKFYPSSNSTGVVASSFDDVYTFATISPNKFPGIKNRVSTLFKVSRFSVNQISTNGLIILDKAGKLMKDLTGDQKDIIIYECTDSQRSCWEKPKCVSDTYTYDPESRRAIFCNDGILTFATFTGYVIDDNRIVNAGHPYLIHCENGLNCVSLRPKDTTYFINSGKDASTHSLIHCSNSQCETVIAEIGNYVGQEGEGIINCSSTNYCSFKRIRTKMKFANAGSNKINYGIISCTTSKGCVAAKAEVGYYLTYTNTLLIQCTSSSSCSEITPTVNYYNNADFQEQNPSIIKCDQNKQDIICSLEETSRGFYITSSPKHLIHCSHGKKCKYINGENGIYRESLKRITSSGDKRFVEDEIECSVNEADNELNNNKNDSDNNTDDNHENSSNHENSNSHDIGMDDGNVIYKSEIMKWNYNLKLRQDAVEDYGIIRCVNGKCVSLTEKEIAEIPICEFNNNRCHVVPPKYTNRNHRYTVKTSVSPGDICTNEDRSIFYFATDSIDVRRDDIFINDLSQLTSGKTNCLEVNDSYSNNFFTVGSKIYRINEDCVLQFYEPGYYFINTFTNTLVSPNNINAYNDKNVLLYRCDGRKCEIVDPPQSTVYYADVSKRILRYDVQSHHYLYAYDKDTICIYKDNQCTPNADLKSKEFCITYKGELVLTKTDIKNRETGECYKAPSMTSEIYGYGQYLYLMDIYGATMVTQTGYYIINLSTNSTITTTTSKNKNNRYVIYGCQLSSCKIYEPKASTYYYDSQTKILLKYKDHKWYQPSESSGYAYISLDPSHTYVYQFSQSQSQNDFKIKSETVEDGYYYTIDNEMYHCQQKEYGGCRLIEDTDYYFTQAGEVYYCVYDSEDVEHTECTKQNCIMNHYYAIDDRYYRCESNSILAPVKSRTCSFDKNVVIHFPLSLTREYPNKIARAVENIKKNNNSTAIATNRRSKNKKYLESISGVFTNCTYNVEESKSSFDLVCIHNYVILSPDTKELSICSIEDLGYVKCIESEDNPEKCHISKAYRYIYQSFKIIILTTLMFFFNLFF